MKYIFIALLSLLSYTNAFAETAKDGLDFFARCECAKENVTAGDSVRVNVVLYCNLPFENAECLTKNYRIKGGHSHLLRLGNRQQQRVRLERGIYYAILWQSYVVGSDEVGNIKFPEMEFEGTFSVYENSNNYDPFDPFGFFGYTPRRSRSVKGKCKSESFTLPVIEKPKRSTQEIISSGGQVC